MHTDALRIILLTLAAVPVAACRSDRPTASEHDMSLRPVCQECYDAVLEARRTHPSPGDAVTETLKTYECPCCNTEMSVYVKNGTHMVKCGGCAAEGVAWDQCRPVEMSRD